MIDDSLEISIQGCYNSLRPKRHPLSMEDYSLVHRWEWADTDFAYYIEKKWITLHRSFKQPLLNALDMLLRQSNGPTLDKTTVQFVEKNQKYCNICIEPEPSPRRFKLTVGSEELRMNHRAQLNTMFLCGQPDLNMVDKAIHFWAPHFSRTNPRPGFWGPYNRFHPSFI